MDDTLLSLYVDVCEYASISKAAQANFLSRQSLAKAMDRLESQVGAQLLVRTHTGVIPTEAGKHLLDAARKRLASWNKALARIKALETDLKTLRIGCQMAMIADETLETMLFDPDMPGGVQLVFMNTPKTACWSMMREGKLDLSYTLAPRNDANIVEIPCRCPFEGPYLIMNRRNVLAGGAHVNDDALGGQTVLVLNDPSSSNSHLLGYLNRAKAQVLFMPSTNSLLKDLIVRDTGVLVVPGSAVLQFRDPQIVAKPIDDFPPIMWQSLLRVRDCTAEVVQVGQRIAELLEAQYETIPYLVAADGTVRFA